MRKLVGRLTLSGILGVIAWLGNPASTCAQYTNGMYAEFYTSLGNFTNTLTFQQTPKTVANFVGLATGERPWLDLPSGVVKTNPFYDGLIFHRVIAGFMEQAGSPKGDGTDGPGYQFVDEFVPSLRHDSFGTLSSANSGPDSNGSQFFVTAAPTPWLDDVHTVFGKLYGGSNVVYDINNVATDSNDKPLTNVVITNLVIRRIGTEAEAFDLHTQNLPVVTNLDLSIASAGTNVALTFSNQLNAENWLYYTPDLTTWTNQELGLETVTLSTNTFYRSATSTQEFYRLAESQYQDPLYTPAGVTNRTVVLQFSSYNGTVTCKFDGTNSGTYTWTVGAPGTISSYTYVQDAYRGRLRPIRLSGLMPMDVHMAFESTTNGTFKGTAYPSYPSTSGGISVDGTFTASP